MVIRRLVAAALAVALSGTFAAAQSAKPDKKRRNKQEQAEIELVVKALDGAMAGQPTPSDIEMKMTPYFLKSQEPRTFVPFVLEAKGAPLTDTAMYIRVVSPDFKPDPKARKVEYPWDDIHFISAATMSSLPRLATPAENPATAAQPPAQTPAPGDGALLLQRVFMAVPGTYDVYVVMKERLPERAPRTQAAKMGVLKTTVVVPDFMNGELATSSVLVTDKVNDITAPLSQDAARERPFVFGAQELVPAADSEFAKNEELSIFFQVYNAGLDQGGKPDIVMEYEFHRKEGSGEKFFNKTSPQTINGTNLPPQFDPAKFPVPGGISVPLASFGEGIYRLAIKVTDKVSGKILTHDVPFTVKAAL